MTVNPPRKRKPRPSVAMYSVRSSYGRTLVARTYASALWKAVVFEDDHDCKSVEILKSGRPIQWWTRNFITGEWDFHGPLVVGGK